MPGGLKDLAHGKGDHNGNAGADHQYFQFFVLGLQQIFIYGDVVTEIISYGSYLVVFFKTSFLGG